MDFNNYVKATIDNKKYSLFLSDGIIYAQKNNEKDYVFYNTNIQKRNIIKCSVINSINKNKVYLFNVLYKQNKTGNGFYGKYKSILSVKHDARKFNKISFTGKAINCLYPPLNSILDISNEYNYDGSKKIFLKPYNDKSIKIEGVLNEHNVTYEFSVITPGGYDLNTKNLGDIYSVFSIYFNEQISIKDVEYYVNAAKKIFSFCFFDSNITFDKIDLLLGNENDLYEKIGEYKIYFENISKKTYNACINIHFDEFKDTFSSLFNFIACDKISLRFIPCNSNDDMNIYPENYIILAGTFEELLKRIFDKDIKADSKMEEAINLVNDFIDKKDQEFKGNNKNMRECLSTIKDDVNRLLNNSEQKFLFAYKKFYSSIVEFIDNVESRYRVNLCSEGRSNTNHYSVNIKINEIAKAYSSYRNSSAHGNFKCCERNAIIGFEIIRVLIYVIILNKCDFDKEKIYKFIRPLFFYL